MSISTIEDRELSLNSQIGKSYPYDIEVLQQYGYKVINSNANEIELEKKEYDGCSFAILYDKNNMVMKSWRYTSTRDKCKRSIPVTGA